MNCGRDLAPLLPLCHCETQGNQSALWWIRLQDERMLLLFFLKYTNNIKPVPICYVPARSLLLFLPPFFLRPISLFCHCWRGWLAVAVPSLLPFPSPPPFLLPFLHIHFMLNWWIKLSLAQNQSWLALPYSFTLDHNPKEKEARERERVRERQREREGSEWNKRLGERKALRHW